MGSFDFCSHRSNKPNSLRALRTSLHGRKWFCYGNKIKDYKYFFVAATKHFAAATKRFVDRTKHFLVVTKYFCYPYFNK